MEKLKVNWYTLCWNEGDIVRYIVDYWKYVRQQVDLHVIVYDNYSTDSCLDELRKYDWIEIRRFKTDGMNDPVQAQIKNTCWLESKGKCDFVIVSDFDEVLWGDISSVLGEMKRNGYTCLGTRWYAFCGLEMPSYEEGKYLHQLVKRGYYQYVNHMEKFKHLGKFMVIDPNKVDTMNWSVGNHICNPKPGLTLYVTDKVVAFHVNKGLSEDYFTERRQYMAKRLSEINKQYGMCIEYTYPEDRIREEYRNYVNDSVDISDI